MKCEWCKKENYQDGRLRPTQTFTVDVEKLETRSKITVDTIVLCVSCTRPVSVLVREKQRSETMPNEHDVRVVRVPFEHSDDLHNLYVGAVLVSSDWDRHRIESVATAIRKALAAAREQALDDLAGLLVGKSYGMDDEILVAVQQLKEQNDAT